MTAKLGDETLAVERVDITHSKRRDEFVKQLTKDRPGIDAKAVEGELLKLAGEAATGGAGCVATIFGALAHAVVGTGLTIGSAVVDVHPVARTANAQR